MGRIKIHVGWQRWPHCCWQLARLSLEPVFGCHFMMTTCSFTHKDLEISLGCRSRRDKLDSTVQCSRFAVQRFWSGPYEFCLLTGRQGIYYVHRALLMVSLHNRHLLHPRLRTFLPGPSWTALQTQLMGHWLKIVTHIGL
jgi:hypothetical protein